MRRAGAESCTFIEILSSHALRSNLNLKRRKTTFNKKEPHVNDSASGGYYTATKQLSSRDMQTHSRDYLLGKFI